MMGDEDYGWEDHCDAKFEEQQERLAEEADRLDEWANDEPA